MRIGVVSAHFPPNFRSGGTLAPQRLARAFAAAGHDVFVYAGHLDDQRPGAEAWDDVEETGLAVRWIEVHPWIGWSDTNNFDNPRVTADYRDWLTRVQPDVVHVHSCQALGVGVVEEAGVAGIPVVLTMHDFWWCCARQFLADRSYVPCSLVVDAGVCACEVDQRWLGLRNARLRDALAHVDVVLCPSASAASVMAANGVDPSRLRVDENGLPPSPEAPPARYAERDSVVFRYTGGWNEMKGVRIVIEAVRALAQTDAEGWRVVAHDIDDFVTANDVSLAGLPIDAVPGFAPVEAAEVWAATDVLLVPSIMRESHSLVTREALTAGVPVICTDTLGPEEVVVDCVNGLIVPAADAAALADAMRRVIDDRELLATMRAACAAVPVRPITDQVAGLLTLYSELVGPEREKHGPARPVGVERVLFLAGIDGAPLRYRAFLPAEALGLLGVHTDVRYYRDLSVPALAAAADAIVVYRVPATSEVLALIAQARGRGVPVLFDVDDLIFDPELAGEIPALSILPADEAALWLEGVRRYRTTMEACDAFIGSTEGLCAHAAAVTGLPAHRLANGVGLLAAQHSDTAVRRPRSPGPLRLGYLSGTDTHDHDWAMIEPAVVEVMERHAGVELWLVGLVAPSTALDRFAGRVKRIGFTAWRALPRVLRDLDVNLAPLTPDSRFNEAKSAIKWLEAALVETPTVASPTEPFREAIDDARNGLLARSHDGWVAALDALLGDAALRRRLGTRARRDALLRWSPHLQAHRYLDILDSRRLGASQPVNRPSRTQTSGVVPSERYIDRPLEAYELPRQWSVALPPRVRMQYRRLRAFVWRSYRTLRRYGPIGVVRRVPSRLRRRPR